MTEPTTTTMESVLFHDVHEHQECSQTTHENSTTDNFSGLEDQPKLQNGSSRSTLEELEDLKEKVAALTARLDRMTGENKGVTQSGVEEDEMSEKSAVKDDSEEDSSEGEDSEEEGSGEEGPDGEDTPEPLSLEIKRLSMDTWSTYQNLTREEVSENVLVVYQKSVTRRDLGTENVLDADSQDGWSGERIQHIPQRLQINSGALLSALRAITNTRMSPPPCIMVPPFKAVIGSHNKIQKVLERKEATIRKYQQQRDKNSTSIRLATLEKTEIEQELKY